MKKNINLCVDLVTLMKQGDLQVLDSRKGTLFRNEEDKATMPMDAILPTSWHRRLTRWEKTSARWTWRKWWKPSVTSKSSTYVSSTNRIT